MSKSIFSIFNNTKSSEWKMNHFLGNSVITLNVDPSFKMTIIQDEKSYLKLKHFVEDYKELKSVVSVFDPAGAKVVYEGCSFDPIVSLDSRFESSLLFLTLDVRNKKVFDSLSSGVRILYSKVVDKKLYLVASLFDRKSFLNIKYIKNNNFITDVFRFKNTALVYRTIAGELVSNKDRKARPYVFRTYIPYKPTYVIVAKKKYIDELLRKYKDHKILLTDNVKGLAMLPSGEDITIFEPQGRVDEAIITACKKNARSLYVMNAKKLIKMK